LPLVFAGINVVHFLLSISRGKQQMSKIVLCVDDSVTMQMVADITFRGTELTYVGARSVDEAMEKLKGAKPALVLADSHMPGKSGYDLCQAIKSDSKFAGVPIAILVGNSAPYDAAKGAAAGVDANITKPWDTAVMLKTCQDLIAAGATAKPGAAAPAAKPAAAPVIAAPAAKVPTPAPTQSGTPPRSATIMGMPTIKVPGGGTAPAVAVTPVAAPAPAAVTPAPAHSNRTTVMAVPPISSSGIMVAPAAATTSASAAPSRAPMLAGTPSKRSALVERTLAKMAAQLAEATGLQPGSPELLALLKLSTEVVERIVWEVVPDLAEQIIRENLQALTAKRA
jgi:CheY-like chemotaxis protein